MVSVHHTLASSPSKGDWSVQSWLDFLSESFSPEEIEVLRRACEMAAPLYEGNAELTGAPLLQHAMGSASILVGMNMDVETIVAAVLHAVPEYLNDWEVALETRFGANITKLVEGISRMEQIQELAKCSRRKASRVIIKKMIAASRLKGCAKCCWLWWKTFAWF